MNVKLTKAKVDSIPLAESGQAFYWDTDLAGFGLRVGANTKSYFAEGRVNGKTVRYTIGKHGVFTAEQARKEAREHLVLMAKGINPNEAKADSKAKGVTLEQAFEAFLEKKKAKNKLKPRTIYDYQRFMGMLPETGAKRTAVFFNDWRSKALVDITPEMVEARHRKIGQNSQAQANLAMRFLRALFYFSAETYRVNGKPALENPVKRLSKTDAWYEVERKDSWIKDDDLPEWFKAVMSLKNDSSGFKRETVRDYLLLLLFTGLRRGEGASLRWDQVDFKARTFRVLNTKNRKDHTLPMSRFVHDLLISRRESAKGAFVFPGDGRGGYIVEPRKQMERVTELSGIAFALHDLRRTFTTIAERLDISVYAIKRMLNHNIKNSDVTAGYIGDDVDRLRGPMQKISTYILSAAGVEQAAKVEKLPKKNIAKG